MKSARSIVTLAAVLLSPAVWAQTSHDVKPPQGPPKVEVFLGYSYLRALPTYAAGNRLVNLNGGSASLAFNFNRYLGLVGDFGGFGDTELNLTGPGVPTPHVAASGGNAYTYLGGPRLSLRGERFTPFVQVLAGGIHASAVTLDGCTGTGCTPLPSQNSFALTAGGGLDITLTRHIALRAFQAEYLMTRFADPTTQAENTQNDMRLSSGLLFRFGGEPTRLPVNYTCSSSPATVYPGDPIMVTGSALSLNPKRPVTYTWTGKSGPIPGTASSVNIDTHNTAPGTYTVQGHVTQGIKPWQSTDCSASYTVLAFQPPTVSCVASPSSVLSGTSVMVTAQGVSPQNRPLTYSYATSAGSITGSASSANLNTAGVAPGVLTVTCSVVDDTNQTASATTSVAVTAPPQPIAVMTQNLCSISFARDKRRPVRVDNEAKACLDDIALNLQRTTDSKVALIGHNDATDEIAAQRAANARDYLVTDKGIESSRVVLYTGSNDSKTVDAVLLPSGAKLDSTGLTAK